MAWIQFFISSAIIIVAGVRLTKDADVVSDRLNIGKAWIGIVLLGLVTSLPEAISSVTAIVSFDAVDLAVGNMVGSNNFNLMLLVLMDLVYRKDALTNVISYNHSHRLSGALASVMAIIIAADIYSQTTQSVPVVAHLGVGVIAVAIIYLCGMRMLARLSSSEAVRGKTAGDISAKSSSSSVWVRLAVSSVFVVGGAMWLASSAEMLAQTTGLGRTFVGSIFLALATSLPEMVVTLSALKMNSFDLALGNIFGSNMINMFIIFICDSVYVKGPILAAASQAHILMAVVSVIVTGIVLVGIKSKNKKKVFGVLGVDTLSIAVIFVLAVVRLYSIR